MIITLVAASLCALSITPSPVGSASFPGANGRIAFTSERGGPADIYTVNPDGTDERRLTDDPAGAGQPSWSPDGTEIAFSRSGDIYVMDADGSNQRMVTGPPRIEFQPSWSPDNTKIVFTRYVDREQTDIVVVDLATGVETQLTETPGRHELPSWSPDGTTIAYVGPGQVAPEIHVMDADGANQRSLGVVGNEPNWSPDGSQLAFASRDPATVDESAIFVMGRDGSSIRQLTFDSGQETQPSWAPDGTEIVFASLLRKDGDPEIYRITVDGQRYVRVIERPGNDEAPNWQPVQFVPPAPTSTTTPAVVPSATPRITG